MELVDRYQLAAFDLLQKARVTQREVVEKAGTLIAEALQNKKRVYLNYICHNIQDDFLERGGGPAFYQKYDPDNTVLEAGDVLFLSSVSGRTEFVVNLAYDCMKKDIKIIVFTSMSYATCVDSVHPSGMKLYEMADLVVDNCAPKAEAMLEVEGIDAKFAAASGLASDFLLWSITAAAVEKMLKDGYVPTVFKSVNFPGGLEYYNAMCDRFKELGY